MKTLTKLSTRTLERAQLLTASQMEKVKGGSSHYCVFYCEHSSDKEHILDSCDVIQPEKVGCDWYSGTCRCDED